MEVPHNFLYPYFMLFFFSQKELSTIPIIQIKTEA